MAAPQAGRHGRQTESTGRRRKHSREEAEQERQAGPCHGGSLQKPTNPVPSLQTKSKLKRERESHVFRREAEGYR